MTCLAVYFSGDVTSAYALFYFWPCIYAFYFFSGRRRSLNVAFVCANYAAVIALMGAADRRASPTAASSTIS